LIAKTQKMQTPKQNAGFSSVKIHLENWFEGKELGAKLEILSVFPNTKKFKIRKADYSFIMLRQCVIFLN
jgi:hypothetical protein